MVKKTSLDKAKIKILLLEGIHQTAVEAFRQDGYTNIDHFPKALPEPELLAAGADAYFVGIRSGTTLTAGFFEHAKRIAGVGCFCIGTNQVDLEAAQAAGVPVFNAPFSNTRSVAELVLAEAILLLRGIPYRAGRARQGGWIKSAAGSHEARGRCLGIIGYGHIGSQVSVLAEALGMTVLFYDVEARLALGNARPVASIQALLETADVVTLHVPETPQTAGMIGAAELALMKPGAHLINASRGTVVDIEALAEALRAGRLGGAAIDVFPSEPKSAAEEFSSPLREFENVILTPHIGGSTEEAQASIGSEVAHKLLKYSNNGSTLGSVNFPEVSLPEHPGKQRLLHIHRNRPGVLASINAVFSARRINISGQYLQTNSQIGYVVVDIELADPSEILQIRRGLEKIPGTIRTRLLY